MTADFSNVKTANCDGAPDHVLSYSVGTRITLDVSGLIEAVGVCGSPALDWNGDGLLTPGTVAVDLNGDSLISVLRDSNDWAGVSFTGINDANGASPNGEAPKEIIIEDDLSASLPVTTR